EPIRDAAGAVVGILFVGFDTSDFQRSLEQLSAKVRLFDNGGLYLLDPSGAGGKPLVRGLAGQPGKPLAELLPDADPAAFVAALKSEGVLRPAPALLNAKADDAWLVARQASASGLWVVAEVLDHEALREHWASQRALW